MAPLLLDPGSWELTFAKTANFPVDEEAVVLLLMQGRLSVLIFAVVQIFEEWSYQCMMVRVIISAL